MDIAASGRVPAAIEELGPWFHNLHLPGGAQTAPDHPLGDFPAYKWKILAPHLPSDLSGWRALDIGCNAGFYSIELATRGASVVGIDLDPHYLAQARWAAEQFELQGSIEFRQMQVYDLAHIGEQFDLVLFMGVFYHLRYPMLALDIVARTVKRLMLFQSLMIPGGEVVEDTDGLTIDECALMQQHGWPKMAFVEHRLAGDPTNWWIPNHAGVEAILRSSGMRIRQRVRHEMYLCEPDRDNPSSVASWNAAELLSATGRQWLEEGA
jgi:tRNA (mo5U34)-methyltransferase